MGHLQDPLVPAGRLRLGFAPSFASWDSRWTAGTDDGTDGEEPLGADLTDPTGRILFPGLSALQNELQTLTEGGSSDALLGAISGMVTKNVTRLDFSAHVGVFDWLTIGATLPWVKTRTAVDVAFRPDAGANLGLNPLLASNAEVSSYLQGLDASAGAAAARAQVVCEGAPGTVECSAAQALADRARSFADASRRAYLASTLYLVAGSEAAEAVGATAAALSGALAEAGLPSVGTPPFAAEPLDAAGLVGLPADPAAGISATPLEGVTPLWAAGDLEVSATLRLLNGEVRDSGAAVPRLRWTVAGGALVRLGTGTPDDPAVLFDVGTGDGQSDVEGFAYGALDVGTRLGVRFSTRYGVQRAITLLRRVAPHDQLLVPANLARAVRWTPGAYLDLTLSPRLYLNETLALAVDYHRFDKSADEYVLAAPAGDGSDPDPTLLAHETAMTQGELGIGFRYATLAAWRDGRASPPLEVSARLVLPLHGRGGQTPRATRGDVSVRLFRSLWGR